MSKTPLAALAISLTLLAGAAQAAQPAATVGAVNGEVLVGAGSGFAAAKPGGSLKTGDRVVARTGGATLRYADGCKINLAPGGMATIGERSPCAGGAGLVQTDGGASAQFFSRKIGVPKWPVGAYFAGAGVAVILGAIVYGITNDANKDDKPVSN